MITFAKFLESKIFGLYGIKTGQSPANLFVKSHKPAKPTRPKYASLSIKTVMKPY